jgi:catechol 2,3-dioxygenase-like lactoylglutathione lyase family enzyme
MMEDESMASIQGPDFITLLVRDLEVSRKFYVDVIGLKPSPEVRPGAVAFATKPIGIAIRKPPFELDPQSKPGYGILIWFKTDDTVAFHKMLKEKNVPMMHELEDGPFGKSLMFQDPDGYLITVHDGG